MADFLSTGVSGLLAFQRALDTTSHNIANVGTEGYSRQRAEFMTRPPQPFGNGWVGSGVDISTVKRIYDDLLAQGARTSSSAYSGFSAFAAQTERVNNLFASTTTGLSATLQKFANALQDVANTPTSIAARQVLLSEARGLTERLKSFDSQLAGFERDAEVTLSSEVAEISTLAQGIAQLNAEIASGLARTGNPPNDLLDQRDRMLDQLSSHLDVTTVAQGDGQLNVFIGSGQPLVLGSQPAQLVATTSEYDLGRHGVGLQMTGGGVLDITSNLSGGTLGGLLDFRTQVLDPARNTLGRVSLALAEVINEQHHAGVDLTGQLGLDLFATGGVESLARRFNAGTGTLAVTRTDVSAVTLSDYVLERTAGGWALRREDTGASVTLSGTGTGPDPFTADGLAIVVSGTAQTGDRFLIRPTRGAAAGLNVLINDPSRVAAAAPIRTASNGANTGTGLISAGAVVDAANPALRNLVTIQFVTPTTYSVNGGPAIAYTSGAPITVNGWSVAISGNPAAGDSFTVSDNSSGSGDNRNALALVDALGSPVLDGGTASLKDAMNRFIGDIGVATRLAQANRDAQQVVHSEAVSARDSVSGVNLDEEASNLLRYQQAYQAAAQLIRVASTLFDTLLNATNR